MSKIINLFTIEVTEVLADYDDTFINLRERLNNVDSIVTDQTFDNVKDLEVIKQVEIERIVFDCSNRLYNEKLFVFSPELKEIMDAKYRIHYSDIINDLDNEIKNFKQRGIDHYIKNETFKSLPWYKRVWKAFKREI